jgi:hypothetical protein
MMVLTILFITISITTTTTTKHFMYFTTTTTTTFKLDVQDVAGYNSFIIMKEIVHPFT